MKRRNFLAIPLLSVIDNNWKPFDDKGVCRCCGKKLSDSEIFSIAPTHFNLTCFKHRNVAEFFNLQVAKKQGLF